jgi:hypothetical protein
MIITAQKIARRARWIPCCLLGLWATPGAAQQFAVGADAACSTNSIQSAINAASDGYTIRIARNLTYTAQALTITNRNLTLIGGYDTCATNSPSGATTLSGLGGAQDSVITIRGDASVRLENLSIIRGDEVSDGYGGGVDYRGRGDLSLFNTALTQNYAGYGGGLSVISEGGAVNVEFGTGTVVQLNTAQYSGGGVRLEGNAHLEMIAPNSIILSNTALGINPSNNTPQYGNGGGLQVLAPASADIGSPGLGNSGPIANNTARYGGGIAIDGADGGDLNTTVRVRIFSTDPATPTRIHGNRATQSGGGIHLLPLVDGLLDATSSLPILCAWNWRLEDNRAQQGAAIYGDTAFGTVHNAASAVYINDDGHATCPLPNGLGSVACGHGILCNTITGNRSVTAADVPTAGATVLMQNEGRTKLHNLRVRDNQAGSLLRLFEPESVELAQLLVVDNILSESVLRVQDGGAITVLHDTTIAGNTLSAAPVLSVSAGLDLARSLIWQPGNAVASISGTLAVDDVLAHEVSTLGGGPEAIAAPARFVDPQHGDYSLQVASAGVDFATPNAANQVDVDGLPRDVDLPVKADFRGPRDVGALERQSVGNLVLNPGFPMRSDGTGDELRLWTQSSPALATWTSEVTPAGAGAVLVRYTPPAAPDAAQGAPVAYVGLSQCVNIPNTGVYRLNGWSRVPGTISVGLDYARIHWRLRGNGPDCVGTVNAEGNHFLSRSNSWSLTTPAQIDVAPGVWTSNATLELSLEVLDGDTVGTNAVDAYFDEISLIATGAEVDAIFRNGFE